MANTIFEKLMGRAKELESRFDTDWSDNHPEAWEKFDQIINQAYDNGQITAEEFDEIACVGFYEYTNFKCAY